MSRVSLWNGIVVLFHRAPDSSRFRPRATRVPIRAKANTFFSPGRMVNEPGALSLPFSLPRRSALSYFRVRTLRYVSRLIYGRSINTNVHTGAACANQWRDTTCTRVWCLRGREDAWIYTTCLPLKSFGGGIRRFNNSRCLFSYGYDARLGANFEIEKVFILCLSLSLSPSRV